jgi:hypothetical protein
MDEMNDRVAELTKAHNACVRSLQRSIDELRMQIAELAGDVSEIRTKVTNSVPLRELIDVEDAPF